MINFIQPDSTGPLRLDDLNELPPVEETAIREYRAVTGDGKVVILTKREAKKFLMVGHDVTIIDHRQNCNCLYCRMMRDPIAAIKKICEATGIKYPKGENEEKK
jgi:hypothetical protein